MAFAVSPLEEYILPRTRWHWQTRNCSPLARPLRRRFLLRRQVGCHHAATERGAAETVLVPTYRLVVRRLPTLLSPALHLPSRGPGARLTLRGISMSERSEDHLSVPSRSLMRERGVVYTPRDSQPNQTTTRARTSIAAWENGRPGVFRSLVPT